MQIVKVPQLSWYDTKELELSLPDNWQVDTYNMAGYDRPALKPSEIQTRIANPTDSPRIRELAKGKKEVVIIVDDTTRGTKTATIAPFVLEELAEAGITDKHIRFIVGFGMHGAMAREDMVKKLGEDIVARFPVYNHNPYANCTYVGTTSIYKTDVHLNDEVLGCDLRIAIGTIVPHSMSGFSGGGKIILPGVSSYETIKNNHDCYRKTRSEHVDAPVTGMGHFDKNPMRADIDEAAKFADLDILINGILNTWGELVSLYAGALEPTYAAAIKDAKAHYVTPKIEDNDIVIANAFNSAKMAQKALPTAYPAVRAKSGTIVVIANAPDGPAAHYLAGGFGNIIQANRNLPSRVPQHVGRLILYTEYPDGKWNSFHDPKRPDMFIQMNNWDDVIGLLKEKYGDGSKVAVYPNSDCQYCIDGGDYM
jgi:lactate racemase